MNPLYTLCAPNGVHTNTLQTNTAWVLHITYKDPPENIGCIIECDINYTSNAKFQTYKFPLAPKKLKIKKEELSNYQLRCLEIEGKVGKTSKLILNLKNKNNYVVHYEILKIL